MNEFVLFLRMGFDHIADVNGYDHMLFVIVLCARYPTSEWKKVAILITAFTIGHSTTLVLSALKIIIFEAHIIELLIPFTILCTSISNLYSNQHPIARIWYSYCLALFFGLIHGMGFSNFFNALMGQETSLTLPLFAFNLGLEAGQLLIVAILFTFYVLLRTINLVEHRAWTIFFSGAGAGVSVILLIEKFQK